MKTKSVSRSRKGAWIEIDNTGYARQVPRVAPVRERGLKYKWLSAWFNALCHSRKGAWIEIANAAVLLTPIISRSRKGAWIEISEIQPPLDCVLRSLS